MCAALPLQETQKQSKLCHGLIYRFVPEKYRYTEKRQALKKENEKGSGARDERQRKVFKVHLLRTMFCTLMPRKPFAKQQPKANAREKARLFASETLSVRSFQLESHCDGESSR